MYKSPEPQSTKTSETVQAQNIQSGNGNEQGTAHNGLHIILLVVSRAKKFRIAWHVPTRKIWPVRTDRTETVASRIDMKTEQNRH